MKTLLLVVPLLAASLIHAQDLSVAPVCNSVCTSAAASDVVPGSTVRAAIQSYCSSASELGVVVFSFSAVPCSSGAVLLADPGELIMIELMQFSGGMHTHSIDLPLSLGPASWVEQPVFLDLLSGHIWTVAEAWLFTMY